MSFEESIIVPLSVYTRCKFIKGNEQMDLLQDSSLPTDTKMKLYHQAQSRKRLHERTDSPLPTSTYGEHIILQLPVVDRSNAKAILEIFKKNPSLLSWTDKDELIIGGDLVQGSNLVRIFQFLTNNFTMTTEDDIPIGSSLLYKTLMSLGVPDRRIRQRPPTRKMSGRKKPVISHPLRRASAIKPVRRKERYSNWTTYDG